MTTRKIIHEQKTYLVDQPIPYNVTPAALGELPLRLGPDAPIPYGVSKKGERALSRFTTSASTLLPRKGPRR